MKLKTIKQKVIFNLSEKEGKTILDFIQEDVPEACVQRIESGWVDYYWKPIKDILENK